MKKRLHDRKPSIMERNIHTGQGIIFILLAIVGIIKFTTPDHWKVVCTVILGLLFFATICYFLGKLTHHIFGEDE